MPTARALDRRAFLRLAGLVSASAALAACGPLYARLGGDPGALVAGEQPLPDALRESVLQRLTFGPRVDERMHMETIGPAAWIEAQLAPETIDDTAVEWRLRQFATLAMSASDLADLSDKIFDEVDRRAVPAELRQATLIRQVYSRRQLYESMAEFWSDHFNISVDKGDCFFLKTIDDREVVRRHALGRFRDLLWASAHSPAMLVYLDNQVNIKGTPNENYAREVMELHTLGVDGGYSQHDVMELARAFTGWSVKDRFWRGQFEFNADQHEGGGKQVLGMRLEAGGQDEAERVLGLLATHPATALFIARKLARRFLADAPPEAIVQRAADAFLKTSGDIKAVLRVILLDGLASSPGNAGPKFKRPAHFVVSAMRALNAETDGGPAVQDYLARMGQPYFGWPTPDGFPDRAEPWRGNLLPRWQFALALARGEIPGTSVVLGGAELSIGGVLDRFSASLLGSRLVETAAAPLTAAIARAKVAPGELPAVLAAGLMGSPAFQWH